MAKKGSWAKFFAVLGETYGNLALKFTRQAALVGRLVSSIMHTNSADQARAQLQDIFGMAAEYLTRAVLKGVLGQRLEVQACVACGKSGVGARRLGYELVGLFWQLYGHPSFLRQKHERRAAM